MTGYDHKHRQDRAALLADRPPCIWCHNAVATQADHVPPLAAFAPGDWQGQLVPSCGPCNASRGGKFAAQRRKPKPVNTKKW